MKYKKSIISSIILGAVFASAANASLLCEPGYNFMTCENTDQAVGNTYGWSTSGPLSVNSTGPFAEARCGGWGQATLFSTVTHSNGTSSTLSKSITCSGNGAGSGNGGSTSGGGGGGNPPVR